MAATRVEYAVSGRAVCRWCSKKIGFGSPRVGVDAEGDYGTYTKWFHASCFDYEPKTSLRGMSRLKPEDQQIVRSKRVEQEKVQSPLRPLRVAIDEAYREEHEVALGSVPVQIVGCQYYEGTIHAGEMADLVREPSNPYDRNAIRVDNLMGVQVGHLKRIFAAALSPLLDDARKNSAMAPRLEAIVDREPANMYSVQARIEIRGLPEHADALEAHFSQFGLTLSGPNRPHREKSRAAGEKELDDIFDSLEATEDRQEIDVDALREAASRSMKLSLLPHQIRGVARMISLESGCSLAESHRHQGSLEISANRKDVLPPLWSERTERGKKVFFNQATNSSTQNRPAPVRGGMLCDAMGLGKTLQILALISMRPTRRKTLVVCPASLVSHWISQARQLCRLKAMAYHGSDRDTTGNVDIVVTTYGILSSEFKKSSAGSKRKRGLLRDAEFDRVVLDEAHVVRNVKTKAFQAVFDLKATYRWCVTGTPFVNATEDIMALFAFLRTSPVDDASVFKRCISRPVKYGESAGLARLRVLLRSLTIRRGKDVLSLPPRTLEIRHVDVLSGCDANEKAYEALFQTASAAIHTLGDDALRQYSSILEVITRLRQICSSGASLLPPDRVRLALKAYQALSSSSEGGRATLTKDVAMSILSRLEEAYEEGGDMFECCVCLQENSASDAACLPCGHFYCSQCADRLVSSSGMCAMCRAPFVGEDVLPVSEVKRISAVEKEDSHEVIFDESSLEDDAPKLTALMELIRDLPETEKVVVFSQFLGTLRKLKARLDASSRDSGLFQGSLSLAQRAKMVESFQRDGGPRVMLVSLKCGGTGLNLTRASTVVLLDPFWNASTEEQAMDRVHRIGQTRPVRAIKFVARGTIEERILRLQETKSVLSEGAHQKLSAEQLRQVRLGQIQQIFERND